MAAHAGRWILLELFCLAILGTGLVLECLPCRAPATRASMGPAEAGGASFAADTWVSTPSGMRPIQEIVVGDPVHAWDFAEHRIVTRNVRQIHHRRARGTIRIDFGSWKLELTPDHRLWSATHHRWRRADELRPGEVMGVGAWNWVWKHAAGFSRVFSVETRPARPVYNVDLHLADNYLVGPDRVIASDYLPAVTSNPLKEALP